jgi:hypothetical protein
LQARIGGIQTRIQNHNVDYRLRRLEQRLQLELAKVLKQEELMWFQRSRSKWLADGDHNTRYYHLKTANRRRRNNIIMLRKTSGEWVDDMQSLQAMVTDFYQELFTEPPDNGRWYQTAISYPVLEENTNKNLATDLDNMEVKNALFSMHPWKSPGPDGYPAGFYQQAWDILGESVTNFVRDAWLNPQVLGEVNYTDICLIPKIALPEYVGQFRLISLCNTLYKIFSKVVVNRLKDCIPLLVSPFQTGFIPGRSIHENIIVA